MFSSKNFSKKTKSCIPPGRWEKEIDSLLWNQGEFLGLILRMQEFGSLCGYVGIPKGHPLYGIEYDEVMSRGLTCHGGLTFSGECDSHRCCQGSPLHPYWWLGFDCAHAGDYVPWMASLRLSMKDQKYRDISYVWFEVVDLLKQVQTESIVSG